MVTLASAALDFYPLPPSVNRVSLDVAQESHSLLTLVWRTLRRLGAIRATLRQTEPDIVVAMMPTANVLATVASVGLRSRVVVTEHTHPPNFPLGFLREWSRRIAYSRAAAVVALTEKSRIWLEQRCRLAHIAVIPNPVTWPLPQAEPIVSPAQFLGSHEKLLLGVGRLDHFKGFDLLMRAFACISERNADWRLAIVGDGPDRIALREMAEQLGLSERVVMPGRVGNIGDWFLAADLFVLSSRLEGFPNVLVEAMASGLPVVAFDCDTGPREIIRHNVDGMLVSSGGGVEALAQAMERLMSNDGLRARLSAEAIEVRHRLALSRVMTMWDALFATIRSS